LIINDYQLHIFLTPFLRSKPALAINKDKMAISTKKRFGLQIIPIFAG